MSHGSVDFELQMTRSCLCEASWVRLPSSARHLSEPHTSLQGQAVTAVAECRVGHGTLHKSVALTVGVGLLRSVTTCGASRTLMLRSCHVGVYPGPGLPGLTWLAR